MTHDAELLAEAQAALESTGLPDRYWSIGTLDDDRLCLLRDEGWGLGDPSGWWPGIAYLPGFEPPFSRRLSRWS